jgi:hypothetical protein
MPAWLVAAWLLGCLAGGCPLLGCCCGPMVLLGCRPTASAGPLHFGTRCVCACPALHVAGAPRPPACLLLLLAHHIGSKLVTITTTPACLLCHELTSSLCFMPPQAFKALAKQGTTILLPSNAGDPSALMAQAMSIYKGMGSPAAAGAAGAAAGGASKPAQSAPAAALTGAAAATHSDGSHGLASGEQWAGGAGGRQMPAMPKPVFSLSKDA